VLVLLALARWPIWGSARDDWPANRRARVSGLDPRNFDHQIIISLRLLRLVAALVVGAALGSPGRCYRR
jgi:iron complex transport system permease protein